MSQENDNVVAMPKKAKQRQYMCVSVCIDISDMLEEAVDELLELTDPSGKKEFFDKDGNKQTAELLEFPKKD